MTNHDIQVGDLVTWSREENHPRKYFTAEVVAIDVHTGTLTVDATRFVTRNEDHPSHMSLHTKWILAATRNPVKKKELPC